MKKLALLLFFASLSTGRAAIDCGTPVFVSGEFIGYDEKPVFPNPPKDVAYVAWDLKKPLSFCGVTFAPKGNTLTVTADKLEYFGYMTTPGRQSNNAIFGALTDKTSGKEGIKVTVNFDPFYTTRKVQVYVPAELAKTAVVATRVDGGKLQPLYWPGVGFSTVEFPRTAKVLEVYLKSPQYLNWQRMVFNLGAKKPVLTLYRSFPFPTK